MRKSLAAIGTVVAALASMPVLAEPEEPLRIQADVRVLASKSFGGLGIDGLGAGAASGYIIARLIDSGAQPALDQTFLQKVPLIATAHSGMRGELSVAGRSGRLNSEFTLSGAFDGDRNQQAGVVIVPWDDSGAPGAAAREVADWRGKIVIFVRADGKANALPPKSVIDLSNQAIVAKPLAVFNAVPRLAENLEYQRKAEAEEHAGQASPGPAWKYRLTSDQAVPIGQIDRDWVRSILTFATALERRTLTKIGGRLEIAFASLDKRQIDAANVLAKVPGRDSRLRPILFSAHYDHLGTIAGQVYPGADDNASGVAVLLELSRRIAQKPLNRDVEFAFFTGEEHGLLGSRAFAEALPRRVASYAALINVDAVDRAIADDRSKTRTVYQLGAECIPILAAALPGAFASNGLTLDGFASSPILAPMNASCERLATGEAGAPSDQLSLALKGMPSVLITGGLNKDYHQPGDTADQILFDRLERMPAAFETMLRKIDSQP